jgi:hypothetical protein
MQPGNLEVVATPSMQAGHRIIGAEGRATGYPRILCSLKTKDGRQGVGMLEFFFVWVWERDKRDGLTSGQAKSRAGDAEDLYACCGCKGEAMMGGGVRSRAYAKMNTAGCMVDVVHRVAASPVTLRKSRKIEPS